MPPDGRLNDSLDARTHDRCCIGCGHALRGVTSRVCPECGRGFDPDDPRTTARLRNLGFRRGLIGTCRVLHWAFLLFAAGLILYSGLGGHWLLVAMIVVCSLPLMLLQFILLALPMQPISMRRRVLGYVVLLVVVSIPFTDWPIRVNFKLHQASLQAVADRVTSGEDVPRETRVGILRFRQIRNAQTSGTHRVPDQWGLPRRHVLRRDAPGLRRRALQPQPLAKPRERLGQHQLDRGSRRWLVSRRAGLTRFTARQKVRKPEALRHGEPGCRLLTPYGALRSLFCATECELEVAFRRPEVSLATEAHVWERATSEQGRRTCVRRGFSSFRSHSLPPRRPAGRTRSRFVPHGATVSSHHVRPFRGRFQGDSRDEESDSCQCCSPLHGRRRHCRLPDRQRRVQHQHRRARWSHHLGQCVRNHQHLAREHRVRLWYQPGWHDGRGRDGLGGLRRPGQQPDVHHVARGWSLTPSRTTTGAPMANST